MRRRISLPSAVLALACGGAAWAGGGPENVLVVVNDLSEESVQIGRYYMAARGIPRHHIVHVRIPGAPVRAPKKPEPFRPADAIEGGFDGYRRLLEDPVRRWLETYKDARITTIALIRGIPVVAMAKGSDGTSRSTAHLLAVLGMDGDDVRTAAGGFRRNPYHRSDSSIDPAAPLDGKPLYCVGMLNAYGFDDVRRMIDLAVQADSVRPDGTVYLAMSQEKDPRGCYNGSYPKLAEQLKELGVKTEIVPHPGDKGLLENRKDVAFFQFGQASWDPAFPAKNRYLPGAVVDNLTSFGLMPAQFDAATKAGGGQTPVPLFLAAGATAVHGCVAEPTTAAWDPEHLHILRYFSGYDLIESYYMGHPVLPWMNLVVGDPLLQPFARRPKVTLDSFEKRAAEAGKKPAWKLKISAQATREGAGVGSLRLYVDGVLRTESEGGAAEFDLPDFDPAVNAWKVVAVDDGKFRSQGFLEGAPLKKDVGRVRATLDRWTKTSASIRFSTDGKVPVFTWAAPGAKEPVGTRKGRDLKLEFGPDAPRWIEVWVRNSKSEPSVFFFEAPTAGTK